MKELPKRISKRVRPEGLLLLAIVTLALALRIYRLDYQSLWLDEIFSVRDAGLNAPLADSDLLSKLHGPLYYVLLHFWAYLGKTDFLIRLLSALLGVAAIAAIYFLGKVLFDWKVGLLSAFVLSVSPLHVWYSQEARMYVLLILFSILSTLFFVRALERNDHVSFLGYSLATAANLYSHPGAVFLVLGQWLFLITKRRKYPAFFKRWVAYQMVILVGVTPWLAGALMKVLIHSNGIQLSEFGRGSWSANVLPMASLGYTPFAYSLGYSVGPSISELHQSLALQRLVPYWWILLPALAVFGLTIGNGWSFARKYPEKLTLLMFLLFVPVVSVVVLSWLREMPFNVRYTLAAFPAFVIILGAGIAGFRARWMQFGAGLLVTLVSFYSLGNYYFDQKYAKEDSRSAATYVAKAARPKDIILVTSAREPFDYYYKGSSRLRGVYSSETTSHEKLRRAIGPKINGYDRVWLILNRTWEIGSIDIIRDYFDANYDLVDHHAFPGLRIILYERR